MQPIRKAWASFLVQTLEAISNQSEFTVKRCHALMEILHDKLINVGLLIVTNIRYMADSPHISRVHFCVINKLYRLAAVHVHPDDVMVVLPITTSSIRQVLNTPHLVRDQE
ncbi:hypothetical protein RYX36_032669 [Vicia faba]